MSRVRIPSLAPFGAFPQSSQDIDKIVRLALDRLPRTQALADLELAKESAND
jgi:hypothetical protein